MELFVQSCSSHFRMASKVILKDQSYNGRIWGFLGPLRWVGVFVKSVLSAPEPSTSVLACIRLPRARTASPNIYLLYALLESLNISPFDSLILPRSSKTLPVKT